MNLSEFVNTYNGKKVDFDNAYGNQCVDLFRQYCHDVLRSKHTGAVKGAKDLFVNYHELPVEMEVFDKVESIEPLPGDVCIWGGTGKNPYGHVAICLGYDILECKVLVFEQDGFKQDGAKVSVRPLGNMLGVLRFKGGSVL